MTRDEILNMPAGRDLDALVAEKVMGWGRAHYDYVFWQQTAAEPLLRYCSSTLIMRDGDEPPNYYQPFHPSRDIAAAWEVVERMNELRKPFSITQSAFMSGWIAEFLADDDFNTIEAQADTAPLAICRAALLAMEER